MLVSTDKNDINIKNIPIDAESIEPPGDLVLLKILYGVSGEGSGHSSRARMIANHLLQSGHQVKIVSYDRGAANLKDDFDVIEIVGLSIISEDNKISFLKTVSTNLGKLPEGTKAFNLLRKTFKEFEPDCVISDFEPCTSYLANNFGLPLITIDNQHRMRYMDYDCPSSLKKEALLTETVIKAMVPKPWVSLITTFHFDPLTRQHAFLFPPILRENILEMKASEKQHILVYVTAGFDSLINLLPNFSREVFYVYGYNKEETIGNIHYRPFSKQGFLEDLASAKAVIATAGFTLISESLYFAKPYLALPMKGQFEQHLNAHMLNTQGYGEEGLNPSVDSIAAFLYRIPDYKEKLKSFPRGGNQAIKDKLDELLANQMKLLLTFRR
ncbi:hypothetical protein NBRC116493_34370 [Aurantivibrio infirmus]